VPFDSVSAASKGPGTLLVTHESKGPGTLLAGWLYLFALPICNLALQRQEHMATTTVCYVLVSALANVANEDLQQSY
jgi:hypothetical protein